MRKMCIVLALGALTASSMTTIAVHAKSPKLAKCDGQHRRPANANGSILPLVDPASGTTTNGIDLFSGEPPASPKAAHGHHRAGGKPPQTVPPIGMIQPLKSYGSC